jgi:hypothetical protein
MFTGLQNGQFERIPLMIPKIIVIGATTVLAVPGLAPMTGSEPSTFGVLSCRSACRTQDAPGGPAHNKEVELGVLEGLLFVPSKPLRENPNFG